MKIIGVIIIILIVLTVAIACKEQTSIGSEKEVQNRTLDIGNEVEDLDALLEDIDSDLG